MRRTNQEVAHDHAHASVETFLCVPEDQRCHLPAWRSAQMSLPAHFPTPRMGEVVYLEAGSAWGVCMVVHEWLAPNRMRTKVWLEHVSGTDIAHSPTKAAELH